MSRYLGRSRESDSKPKTENNIELESDNQPEVTEEAAPKGDKRRARGCARGFGRFILLAFQLGIIVLILAVVGFIGTYIYMSGELEQVIDQVVQYQGQGPGGTPRFYDRHGTLLFELKTAEKRRWLEYHELPANVIEATIAVEDDTFWNNYGLDPEAIVAALVRNYQNPDERPVGASTITQQLVRHIAFSYEERISTSYERKFREVFLAFIMTRQRSKQDIMTMYLNEIYYGNLAYGIEAAAQTYFGRGAGDLTLAEAAFLSGLPQAPGDLDPYGSNFDLAKERQEFILDLMVAEGMVDAGAAQAAKDEPVELAPLIPANVDLATGELLAPHFILYVRDELEKRYGAEALVKGGWQIKTSLDLNLQRFAEQAAREWVESRAGQHDVNNASIVILKPGTGEILAMVGSLDYFNEEIDGQVNVALQPRQPGSSIKPITYAAAMERGWTAGDVIWDVPIELDLGGGQKMVPVNYDGRYHGPLLLRDALANSYNIPPVQLIRDIGVQAFISTGRKMGIESLTEPPGYYGLALTLGGGEVPLLEMTRAYATLANMGQRPQLMSVLEIVDSRTRFIYSHQNQRIPPTNALDPRIAYILTDILDDDDARAPAMGRNNALNLPFPAAAKTGTTTDFRDNWTLGYTPGVVVGVWVGNTDGHPMQDSSGLIGAAPLWRTIMEKIYAEDGFRGDLAVSGVQPAQEFTVPSGVEERSVCLPRGTGGGGCTASRQELFVRGGPMHTVQRLGYVPDVISNPGAWTVATAAMSADEARAVNQPALDNGLRPPTPTTCVINYARLPRDVSVRLLLPVPPYYPDEVRARIWARQQGYSMAPPTACSTATTRLAASSGQAGSGGEGAAEAAAPGGSSWHIISPSPGQQVSGIVPIMGSVQFNPAEVQYYKLEIGAGSSPTTWTTFGSTHTQPVTNGVLETLQATALAPGNYVIRLIIVRNDGNYPSPYSVPITVVG
ncbi:MAG TPA: transglycosylase domain-containing protein [candidate division Zixibacteria bacterium]|nr:transglycosylase domain-containing protein [candidate division Zixibacteria bacterium]